MPTNNISNIKEVFDYLGSNIQGVPIYLHLLNLYWGEDGKDFIMEKFKNLAIKLKDSPELISGLIRDGNWRPTLVGIAIVILLRAKEFQKDLVWRLENGSWVAPQIAVALALLNDGFAEKELRRIIKNASEESNPKTMLSAYILLKFLENEIANDFEQTKLFEFLKEKDYWDNSIRIATEHWNFWKNIESTN